LGVESKALPETGPKLARHQRNADGDRAVQKFTKLCVLLCAALFASAASSAARAQSTEAQILARLNALERENASLRARLNRLEAPGAASKVTSRERPATSVLDVPAPVAASYNKAPAVADAPAKPRPVFEVSGSFLYLQPGAGDFQQYAEVANPFPIPSPNWSNHSIAPKYSPAFNVALRYIPTASDEIALDWTYLRATDSASVTANSSQFVGPPYSIGPPAGVAFTAGSANGSLQSQYDTVNLTAGHTFCAGCPFALQAFGGVQYARLGETLTGNFQNSANSTYHSYVSSSLFSGAGPRFGIKGLYNVGNMQVFGQAGATALIGTSQNNINFTTASPLLADLGITTNYQSLKSPNATQVVPGFDAKVGTAYTFPYSAYGAFKVELGYQVAVYFDAVSHFALSNVAASPLSGGVYLATEQQLKSNLTVQGPYLQGSWLF